MFNPGMTYRPPFEASSYLLQVTTGCSHNRCSFCTMYRDVPFRIESLESIRMELNEAARFMPHVSRVFLEHGDPFVLPADRLSAIAEMIHEKLPDVDTIAMYASINNIKTKTDAELRRLRQLGINELNIGVESGLDDALTMMNKGYTSQEAMIQLLRLRDAGMDYGANVIFGSAGPEKRRENAIRTAELMNQTTPYLIFTGTIHADPGCPLYEQLRSGLFVENTIGEYLEEEEIFLNHLELEHSYLFGLHPSNVVPLAGWLTKEKAQMLAEIADVRNRLTSEQLMSRPRRAGEGAVLLS